MLSVEQMRDAILARHCDTNPDFGSGLDAARSLVDIPHGEDNKPDHETHQELLAEIESRYENGREVLGRYTLSYDHHSTVYQMVDGRFPGEDDGLSTLRIEQGYRANSQAYATAIFNLRAEVELMTPAEVAAATGTVESGWRNKAAAGDVPGAFKKGKQWLLPRSVLRLQGVDV